MTAVEVGGRYRLHTELDGDFTPARLAGSGAARRVPLVTAADAARQLAALGVRAADTDAALIAGIETHRLARPPVGEHLGAMSTAHAEALACVAARWMRYRPGQLADLRAVNTACKILGALALYQQARPDPLIGGYIATVADQLEETTGILALHLRNRLNPPAPPPIPPEAFEPLRARARARVAVLAPPSSRVAAELLAGLAACGLDAALIAWCPPPSPAAIPPDSHYASAWYPDPAPEGDRPPAPAERVRSWDEAAAALARCADLTVLAGMPIVPGRVLAATRLGAVNAHNGALPALRGMDAPGWAVLTGQPILCTVHVARSGVDTGEVLASEPVPLTHLPTLKARVRAAQVRLLIAVAVHVASSGQLPTLYPQQGLPVQYYRLHPHLKRHLDATIPLLRTRY
ncbi:formyltransferase family protein [Nocardia sp. NBC_01327]|uniref:formyltransferase family protein n=1 Tax=Nocardia sp. NBC_01327 TaxID=2903593 RepID=UPI002E16150B|nr:formyltransferase family protein [Nocardia sp. NBC_01327]